MMNIFNLYNGFHEIAQVLSAKALSLDNRFVTLEQKVQISRESAYGVICSTKEIDLVADTAIWEVKPDTYLRPSKKDDLEAAKLQVSEYVDSSVGYHKGNSLEFPGVYAIKVLKNYYMTVDTADYYGRDISDGNLDRLLFYSLSYLPENGTGEAIPVSIPNVVSEMEDKRDLAIKIFIGAVGITVAEDFFTGGSGLWNDIPSIVFAASQAVAVLV